MRLTVSQRYALLKKLATQMEGLTYAIKNLDPDDLVGIVVTQAEIKQIDDILDVIRESFFENKEDFNAKL